MSVILVWGFFFKKKLSYQNKCVREVKCEVMGKKSNCLNVSRVPQNGSYRSKLFSSTFLDFAQLTIPLTILATTSISLHHPNHHHHHHGYGYHLLSTKLEVTWLENDRNSLQIQTIQDLELLICFCPFFKLSLSFFFPVLLAPSPPVLRLPPLCISSASFSDRFSPARSHSLPLCPPPSSLLLQQCHSSVQLPSFIS